MAIPRVLPAAAMMGVLAAVARGQEAQPPEEPPGLLETLRDFEREGLRFEGEHAVLHVGGRFATDFILWDRRNARHSGLEGGAAAPRIEYQPKGEYRLFVEGDLLGETTPDHLAEGWAEWRPAKETSLRIGLQRVALGTEGATPEEDLPLVGRSFASWIDGRTDLSARAALTLYNGFLWAEWNHAFGHGFGPEGGLRTSPQTSVRAVLHPFRSMERERPPGPLDGVFLGFAGAKLSTFRDPVVLETPLGSTVFRTPDLDGTRGAWLHGEAGLAEGPVAAGLEVARGIVHGVTGASGRPDTMDELTAWSATLAVSLTGETRTWEEGAWRAPVPRGPGGAWEIALRYSNADVDRDLFQAGWTPYDPSTQEVRTFSAVLAWKPARHARVAVGWVKTIADDALSVFGGAGPSAFPRVHGSNRDSSFVLRLEIAF